MGGHGGLNILPQKRWNVYNRDNRLKVQQDEAKARAEEEALCAKAEQAERQFRHNLLKERAAARDGTVAAVLPAPNAAPLLLAPPSAELAAVGEAGGVAAASAQDGHINFWREEEAQTLAQHPEVEAAARDAARKRGKAEYYTSDPKFDERFQLGYNMQGEQPWWAKRSLGYTHAPDPVGAAAVKASASVQPPAIAQQPAMQPGAALAAQPDSQGRASGARGESSKHRAPRPARGSSSESEEDASVAAAKQFLKHALGGQLPSVSSGSSSSSSSGGSSDASSDSDSEGTQSSSSSSRTSSDSDVDGGGGGDRGRKRRRRHASEERQRSGSREREGRKSKERRRGRSAREGSRAKEKHRSKHRSPDRKRRRSSSSRKHSSKDKRRDKETRGKLSSSRRDKKSGKASVVALGPGHKSVEQLRQERLEREQAERARARLVLVGAFAGPAPDRDEREMGYNTGYGYGAGLKKRR